MVGTCTCCRNVSGTGESDRKINIINYKMSNFDLREFVICNLIRTSIWYVWHVKHTKHLYISSLWMHLKLGSKNVAKVILTWIRAGQLSLAIHRELGSSTPPSHISRTQGCTHLSFHGWHKLNVCLVCISLL